MKKESITHDEATEIMDEEDLKDLEGAWKAEGEQFENTADDDALESRCLGVVRKNAFLEDGEDVAPAPKRRRRVKGKRSASF